MYKRMNKSDMTNRIIFMLFLIISNKSKHSMSPGVTGFAKYNVWVSDHLNFKIIYIAVTQATQKKYC